MGNENKGFASLTKEQRKKLASSGGRRGHELGVAHEWTREEAIEAGRRGGIARARNRAAAIAATATKPTAATETALVNAPAAQETV